MDRVLVYFLWDSVTDMVKIGVSTHPPTRRRTVAKNAALLATIHGGFAVERALHSRFSAHRAHGEWFRFDYEIATYVAVIGSGPCDGCLAAPVSTWTLAARLDATARKTVTDAILYCDGNNSRAAKLVGVSRSYLIKLRKQYGV